MSNHYTPDQTQTEIPYGYCHCGCGNPAPIAKRTDKRKNWVKRKPIKYIKGHQKCNIIDRDFWNYVDKSNGEESCWNWTGTDNGFGYGFFKSRGKVYMAHKIAWVSTYGEIKDGLCVLHNCPNGDNPKCCNPKHLWLGTKVENNRDRDKKNRQAKGEKQGSAKLSEHKVNQIREKFNNGVSRSNIAREFNISWQSVDRIVKKLSWKHI